MKKSVTVLVIVCVILVVAFVVVKKIKDQRALMDQRTDKTNVSITITE